MDACDLWVSSQIYVDQGNQCGKLHRVASLMKKTVAKYYPETDETPKGHLNQTRKNIRSTRTRKKHSWGKAARYAVVSKAKEKTASK